MTPIYAQLHALKQTSELLEICKYVQIPLLSLVVP